MPSFSSASPPGAEVSASLDLSPSRTVSSRGEWIWFARSSRLVAGVAVSLWLYRLVIVLKMLPVGKAVSDVYNAAGFELIQKQRARMEEMSSRIPRPGKLDTFSEAVIDPHMYALRSTGNRRSSASLAPVFDPG